jgi:hypothetical protein
VISVRKPLLENTKCPQYCPALKKTQEKRIQIKISTVKNYRTPRPPADKTTQTQSPATRGMQAETKAHRTKAQTHSINATKPGKV